MLGRNRKAWREEVKRLLDENNTLREQNEQLSKHCADHQTYVEVAAEALERKDQELMAFIHKLHNTMGGEHVPTCEAEALEALRLIRGRADKYLAIREVLAGKFDPDQAILRRIACSVGTSQLDIDSVVERAGELSNVHVKNAEMFRELVEARRRIEELEDEA